MKTKPLVSVIIPTYNYAHLICEAIDSVLGSNFPLNEIEIIIIDDGSTDNTADKVKLYGNKIKYIVQDNLGKARATQVGIKNAQGTYIFNLDADDLFLPNKIQEVVNIFESDPDIVHVAHPALCWNVANDTKKSEAIPKAITGRKIWGKDLVSYFYRKGILFGGGSTFACRTEILKQVTIPKKVDMFIDEYLFITTVIQGYSFFCEEPLSLWRIHGKNYSNNPDANDSTRLKLERNLASAEIMLINLSALELERKLKILSELKYQVLINWLKERLNNKTFSDILKLWQVVLTTGYFWGIETWEIIKNYRIFHRTLPTSLLLFLKMILAKNK